MRIGTIKKPKKKLYLEACRDFFNGLTPEAKNIYFYLTRKKVKLNQYELDSLWLIRQNLKDRAYTNFLFGLNEEKWLKTGK